MFQFGRFPPHVLINPINWITWNVGTTLSVVGCPIRTPPDQTDRSSSPTSIAAMCVLFRSAMPRHPLSAFCKKSIYFNEINTVKTFGLSPWYVKEQTFVIDSGQSRSKSGLAKSYYISLVDPEGLEPSASSLQMRCSSQVNYGPEFFKYKKTGF